MKLRLLIPACLLASQVAVAQHESQWRLGLTLSAPTRLLSASSLTAPDSVFGRVDLGFGVGADAARSWLIQPGMLGVVHVRVMTAEVQSQAAGSAWSPGRALILEGKVRLERVLSDRAALFGGVGVSHWSGPAGTLPFTGIASLLLAAEAGVSLRPGGGPWRVDLTADLTRIGANDQRGMATGFPLRWMAGVHHDL